MKRAIILMRTLKLETETVLEFGKQLKELTPEDKEELIQLGAQQLGVPIEDN